MNFSQHDDDESRTFRPDTFATNHNSDVSCCGGESESTSNSNDYIATALHQMSIAEREQVYFEIHGVEEAVEETPELLEKSLEEIQSCLSNLKIRSPADECLGLHLADRQCPEYAQNPLFLKRFLRADRFDAKDAAIRTMKYFNLKLECFGESKLCKDITYKDLLPEDQETLLKGMFQVLPERDRSDRAVVIMFESDDLNDNYSSMESLGRLRMYQFPSDEETQKNGIVAIMYHVDEGGGQEDKSSTSSLTRTEDNTRSSNSDSANSCSSGVDTSLVQLSKMVRKILDALPIRLSSYHYCSKECSTRSVLLELFLKFADTQTRSRTRVHRGPPVQCLYELMTFGIPAQSMPVSNEGRIKLKNHTTWIQMRRTLDEMQNNGLIKSAEDVIEIPSQRDFLVGRGKPIQGHAGNLRLHTIIEDHFDRFDEATKQKKTRISQEIVQAFKDQTGGRFLSQKTGAWMEISDVTARGKIAQIFRSQRRSKPSPLLPDSS